MQGERQGVPPTTQVLRQGGRQGGGAGEHNPAGRQAVPPTSVWGRRGAWGEEDREVLHSPCAEDQQVTAARRQQVGAEAGLATTT